MLAGAGITVGAALVGPAAADANTFTVTSLADDGSPGTLRSAVADAEATPEFDRVIFDSGLSGSIDLGSGGGPSGDIYISYPIEIVGPGAGRVTVNADAGSRIFDIYNPAGPPLQIFLKATISGLTLSGGDVTGGFGGAISSYGADLAVLDSVISGNATDELGGGIGAKYSNLEVDSTRFSGNSADAGGGIGAYATTVSINDSALSGNGAVSGGGVGVVDASSLLVTGSTISGNTAGGGSLSGPGRDGIGYGAGAGISSVGSNTTLSNSTITGNDAQSHGGGVLTCDCGSLGPYPVTSKLTTRNTTIAANSSNESGGGIYAEDYTSHVLLLNTILATNTGPGGPNIATYPGLPVQAGFTLIDDPTGVSIAETTPGSNVIGKNPQLGPLADNGGPTQTMALSSTSPALDAGDGFGAQQDQRAAKRPIELPGIPNSTAAGADGSDIGAFELQGIAGAAGPTPTTCRGRPPTIVAKPGVPTVGTDASDVIVGTNGPDQIDGRGGRDVICGFDGNDQISGGPGNDTLVGQDGMDVLTGNGGRDRIAGGIGDDQLLGNGGRDGLTGGPGDDTLTGGGAQDRLFGKAGADGLFGNAGPDRLFGGPGPDRFTGGPGRNILHLIKGDGDKLVGDNANSLVLLSDRAKRKGPPP